MGKSMRYLAASAIGLSLLIGQSIQAAAAPPAARSIRAVHGGRKVSGTRAPARYPAAPDASTSFSLVPGFSQFSLPANDDGSTSLVPLPFPIDFYGTTYSELYVNNNGNLTFGSPLSTYTPQSLNQIGIPMIAPFWADVDTRVGPVVTYGYGSVNGHPAFGANWIGVGCYDEISSVADTFQVLLISRPDQGPGDYDIEFNYGPLTWDSGQASGGDGSCLGGAPARAGYTSGNGPSCELPGSGISGALLSGSSTGLSNNNQNSQVTGRFIFDVTGQGKPNGCTAYAALGDSYSSGEGTYSYNYAMAPCDRGSNAWPALLSANYPAAPALVGSTFFACSGDTTTEMLNGTPAEPTPQITALENLTVNDGDPELVTVTGGGDDLGFSNILKTCVKWGLIGDFGYHCISTLHNAEQYLSSSSFLHALRYAFSRVATAAGGPSHVVVVGYPNLFPSPSFGNDVRAGLHCPLWLNTDSPQVLSAFAEGQAELNTVTAFAAAEAGVRFVELDDLFSGHELCTADPWINTLRPFDRGAGHPNVDGQKAIAADVAAQLGYLAGAGGGGDTSRSGTRAHAGKAGRAKHPGASAARKPAAGGARPAAPAARTGGVRPATPRSSDSAPAIDSGLTSGQAGIEYTGFLSANGGTGPYTWSVTTGSLPAGLSLDPMTGIISGTPTAAGTSPFTVTATDSSTPAQTATASESVSIAPVSPLAVATSTLPSPTVGQQYSATLAASGGVPAYSWSVSSGSLPAGLSLDGSSGVISGIPASAGPSTFTIKATDSSSQSSPATATAPITVSVLAASSTLQLAAPHLPAGTQGDLYLDTLASTGGSAPLYWSVTSGSLPDGLSLDSGSGEITGVPAASGTFPFTVSVADAASHTAAESLSITVAAAPALTVTAPSLPDVVAGSPYEQSLDADGGVSPYAWSVSAGALPDGLTLDPDGGVIKGTPTTPGTFSFTATATDSSAPDPQAASVSLSITVDAPPPPPSMSLADTTTDGVLGSAYDASVIPANGTGPYSYSVTSGALPGGLTLDPDTGTITGTPTAAGTFTATIEATDSSSPTPQTATDDVSITISTPGSLAVTTSSLPDAVVGVSYAQPIAVTGGMGADSFAVTSGSLPDGLTLDPDAGIIYGTPATAGPTAFTVTVTDSSSPTPATASADLTLSTGAAPPVSLDTSGLPGATQGVPYLQAVTASGGMPPYSWSVSAGALPDGLTLDPDSGIISGTPTSSGTATFTVQATDSDSASGTQQLSIAVDPAAPLAVTTAALDPATQGDFYSEILDSTGGTGTVTWSVSSGALPDGLTLDPDSGIIGGYPTGSGTATFTVKATDSATPTPQTATATLSIEVALTQPVTLADQSISFTAPASGRVGATVKLSARGGGSGNPVVFSVDPASGPGVCAVSGGNGARLTYAATGSCVIDANQAGNDSYNPAPQVTRTITVTRASARVTIRLSSSTVSGRHEKALVITITVAPQYAGTPAGTVTVKAGRFVLCAGQKLARGKATCSPRSNTTLPAGKYKVTAAYSGNGSFRSAVSAAKTLTVTRK